MFGFRFAVRRAILHAFAVIGTLMLPRSLTAAVPVPGREPIKNVDFERHVMGLFSKAGCNNGSCHGSFQGKGGFRLSLFGYDAAKDFNTLTRDILARRIDTVEPDKSLLLLKAAGRIPHEGGVRMTPDSWQFAVLRSWVLAGTPWRPGSGAVAGLTLDAPEYLIVPAQTNRQLRVTARFADGSAENVTAFCDFRVQDDSVAEISPLGIVSAQRPGDTGLVVSYRGVVQALRVLVPAVAPKDFHYPDVPAVNFIDTDVTAKLRLLNMTPSEPATDAEFLRRVTIDTIGSLPSPDDVRAFLADASPDKRSKKIDELLSHPLHAALWATKLSDVTGNNTDALEQPNPTKPRRSQMWHDWLRKRIQDNVPYDEIVRDILTATSREGLPASEWIERQKKLDAELEAGWESHYADRRTLDLFWRRQQAVPLQQWGEKVAAAFLGIRLECAQCHKHPTDRWTQADYRAFANVFQQVSLGASPQTKPALDALNKTRVTEGKNKGQVNTMRELYLVGGAVTGLGKGGKGNNRALRNPDTNNPLAAKALGGPEIPIETGHDAREIMGVDALADKPDIGPGVCQPRLGTLFRHRPGRSGGRFFAGKSTDQRRVARRIGEGFRRAWLRHSPSRTDHSRIGDLSTDIRSDRVQQVRQEQFRSRVHSAHDGRGRGGRARRRHRRRGGLAERRPEGPQDDRGRRQPAGQRQPRIRLADFRTAAANHRLRLRANVRPGPAADALSHD